MMDALHDGDFRESAADFAAPAPVARAYAPPAYLLRHYWWAYVHPRAVRLFERQWLVNAILWGNYRRLRDAALDALGRDSGGRTLQVACAYGDFTAALGARIARAGGVLEVIDALAIQIDNLRAKLPRDADVRTHVMNAAALDFSDARFDRAVLFFLLHEQPDDIRRRTLSEALRVLKPGGRLVVVDYARPGAWNPLRWLMLPVLAALEPFALDLWRQDVVDFAPARGAAAGKPRRFFGGLYQLVVLTRED
ncbi:MAG: rhodoquinone biosynthesis methyltransferase RquA [Rhodoblastus sp.]